MKTLNTLTGELVDVPNALGPAPQTADELRHLMTERYGAFLPHLEKYHDYARQIAALSVEYHAVRFRELGIEVEELVLATSLDARETPKALDSKLQEMHSHGIKIKRVIFDQSKFVYHIFV